MDNSYPFSFKITVIRKIPDINLTLTEVLSLFLLKGGEGLFKGTEIEKNRDIWGRYLEILVAPVPLINDFFTNPLRLA